MKNALVLGIVALLSTSISALEIEHVESRHRADANWCGDINSIATYRITHLAAADGTTQFTLNSANLAVISDAIRHEFGIVTAGFAVTAEYDDAMSLLNNRLGLRTREDGSHHLASCHDMNVLEGFALAVRDGVLVSTITNSRQHYFTVGGGQHPVYTEYTIHGYIDLDAMTVRTFLLW